MRFEFNNTAITLTATTGEDATIFARWPQAIMLVRNEDGTAYECAIEQPKKARKAKTEDIEPNANDAD